MLLALEFCHNSLKQLHVQHCSTTTRGNRLENILQENPSDSCSYSTSRSPKLLLLFLQHDRDNGNVFYFRNNGMYTSQIIKVDKMTKGGGGGGI